MRNEREKQRLMTKIRRINEKIGRLNEAKRPMYARIKEIRAEEIAKAAEAEEEVTE